jgi:7-carboxy-7-deazaguanine synthase
MRCPGWPCDTPHAIYPQQWKNDPLVQPEALLIDILSMPGFNICITGGEPTMQPEDTLHMLAISLLNRGYTIDVFSNGSLKPFPAWMIANEQVSIILDWKLQGSGEARTGVDQRLANLGQLKGKDHVKFVVATEDDFDQAVSLWKDLVQRTTATFWVGCAWKEYDEAHLVERVLAERLPWRVNIQVHKFVWPGVQKGI